MKRSANAPPHASCADLGLLRILPRDTTIAVGQSFVAIYQDGGTCAGELVTDANYHTVPASGWYTLDTLIVRVDSVTGRITGRAAGSARVWNARMGAPLGATVHVQ